MNKTVKKQEIICWSTDGVSGELIATDGKITNLSVKVGMTELFKVNDYTTLKDIHKILTEVLQNIK